MHFNISKGCGLIAIYLVGLFVCENKTPQKWRFVCVGFEGWRGCDERRRRREGQTLPTNGNTFTIAVGNLRILNLLLAHGTLGPTCKWEGDNTWRRLGPSQLHSSTTLTSPSRWVPTYILAFASADFFWFSSQILWYSWRVFLLSKLRVRFGSCSCFGFLPCR